MSLKLNFEDVAKIYCSVLRKCPDCGDIMTPLGDLGIDPYHKCFRCGKVVPFQSSEKTQEAES